MPGSSIPSTVIDGLKDKFPAIEVSENLTITVPEAELLSFMRELRDNPDYDFNFLTNLTAVDYPDNFTVIYNLVSFKYGYTLMAKVNLGKDEPAVSSLTSLWGSADWQEREVYDLFGIIFTGRHNLTRILLEDGFAGYPLRKDFQWVGGRE
ncbi:MAG: NADH-quinone oxidoreductase subunit C [Peptococcaceae bacterium]|jgi:NADH-quinone oxidoreductase subunit C|nr:MAG: NADH-quinone oxidoreductase subunit C [Peptococcaceae bacterium]